MMHILEGESLLNDASGLVCLRFAVAAVLTGSFSLIAAAEEFLWMALGGLAVGVAVSWISMRGKVWIDRRFGHDAGSNILLSLLLPFAAYMIAEHIGTSGILAAVAAGVTMSFTVESGRAMAATRMRGVAVWDMLQYTLNGTIFVLLGTQLPMTLANLHATASEAGQTEPWMLACYVLAIATGLALLRFGWAWLSLHLTLFRARRRRDDVSSPPLRIVAAMSVAGARGAITLAGVLTLPLTVIDGTAFPARQLAIVLAMGVTLVSLVIASVGLPVLLNGLALPAEGRHAAQEDAAQIAAARGAIRRIEQLQQAMEKRDDDAQRYPAVAGPILDLYHQRIETLTHEETDEVLAMEDMERRFWLAALEAERETITMLRQQRKIDSETAEKLTRDIDLRDARLS